LNILFTFRSFEQLTLALNKLRVCPEKQSCPGIFHCIEYVFFIIQDFEQLALALKTEFALNFFKSGGGGSLPPTPPRTPMLTGNEQFSIFITVN